LPYDGLKNGEIGADEQRFTWSRIDNLDLLKLASVADTLVFLDTFFFRFYNVFSIFFGFIFIFFPDSVIHGCVLAYQANNRF